ncbi:hypothetical protein SCHPADRAFT_1001920 [Schizopora paradoxa]|uniref:Uncharacterized protein n=1 Tax=Schizopora paradoxa TaxID=27342 RepID=A0A0H2RQK7_9AGAM|nr:hypothetical protein SCHPADRAFT_1001920 [Schizopora paradoxa]
MDAARPPSPSSSFHHLAPGRERGTSAMDDSTTQPLSIISSTENASHPSRADGDSSNREETFVSSSVKPRRAPGSSSISKVGSGLRSIVTKTIPDRLLSPGIIADEIRRFRRHHETTIFQRHREGTDAISDVDKVTLKALCMRLLLFRERRNTYETRDAALNEFTTLGINDPLVRTLFQQCIIDANHAQKHDVALLPDPPKFNDQHVCWSNFIGSRIFRYDDEKTQKTLEMYSDILKSSLTMSPSDSLPSYSTGYLGSVYLSHALQMGVVGRDLEFLLHLWEYFLQVLSLDVKHGGWEVLDKCICNILSSEKRMHDFLKPSHFVGDLAVYLIWNADKIPTLYRIFFSAPRVQYSRENEERNQVDMSYPPMEHWSIPLIVAYAMTITDSLVISTRFEEVQSLEDLREYARRAQIGTTLANSVLCDETWMAFYTVLNHAINCYRLGYGISVAEGLPRPVRDSLHTLGIWSFNFGKEESNRALAHLISQLFNIDHYLKDVISLTFSYTLSEILTPLRSHEERSLCLQKYTSIPTFENVPYLRRFRINGMYFIASDNLPYPSSYFDISHRDLARSMSVDTMELDGFFVAWLYIDEGNFDESPVLTAGHYPILAGYDQQGRPLYVAAARRDHNWYFTCVEEGKSSAFCVNEFGEGFLATEFFVLALRHAPADLRASYPSLPEWAEDPTGPLYWESFWPGTEYETVVPNSKDNRLLRTFLDDEYKRCFLEDEILSGFA